MPSRRPWKVAGRTRTPKPTMPDRIGKLWWQTSMPRRKRMLIASWHRISRSIINGVGSGPYQGEFVILDSFPLLDFRGKRY